MPYILFSAGFGAIPAYGSSFHTLKMFFTALVEFSLIEMMMHA